MHPSDGYPAKTRPFPHGRAQRDLLASERSASSSELLGDGLLPLAEIRDAGGAAWDPGGAQEPAAESSGLRRRKDL